MGVIGKSLLLFNTVKYLKPEQVVNQVKVRVKPKEQFWKYKKKGVKFGEHDIWLDGLDNDSVFIERFKPEGLLDNHLTLLNETRTLGNWNYSDVSRLWNFNAHYLEYLVPLYSLWKSTGDEKYKAKINEIMTSWYEKGSFELDSNQAYTISLRIVNQLIVSDAVDDKRRLYDSVYAQYRYLLNHQEKHLLGNHYLENLKAIVISSVVFKDDDVYDNYIRILLSELDEEITEDGLHFELSLMYHKIVLEDLIRVAVILKQANKSEYKNMVEYISKMCTALYSLEDDLDRTPLFNDAGDNVAKPADALLSACKCLFDIESEKKHSVSGYYVLRDGKITVIFDCGELAPIYMPGHSHCDCLSFEMFYDGKPIFVNSGTYQYQGDKRRYFRSTAAHNTVVINGHEQSELWGEHRAGRRIWNVRTKSEEGENSIIGSYNNYLGENHTRKIQLENGMLKVYDKTMGDGQSYLHLAPGLKYEDGRIIGVDADIRIQLVNCRISSQQMPYADCFGRFEDTECLVFSWTSDSERHGYKIKIGDYEK
jgi:uncharacterized heparinase superfamily protein